MQKTIDFCDVCIESGEEVIATHKYLGDGDVVYYCCGKCLKDVKAAKLKFWEI